MRAKLSHRISMRALAPWCQSAHETGREVLLRSDSLLLREESFYFDQNAIGSVRYFDFGIRLKRQDAAQKG